MKSRTIIPNQYIDNFISISEELTGFSKYELQATGLIDLYYQSIVGISPKPMIFEYLNKINVIKKDGIEEILFSNYYYKKISNEIIKIWYFGKLNDEYISPESYKEGLIWIIIQSHPPGAKQPGFNTWGVRPEGAQ